MMNVKTKIYLAAGAAVALMIIWAAAASFIAGRKAARLERSAAEAKAAAARHETAARQAELRAAEYKQKLEYMEESLSALSRIARKQDEELEKLNINVNDARRDVGRARAVRNIESTTADLCTKLAELGHPCE
jgi:predicted RNase H-like nuclease (RuvC/YqgF family)